MSAHYRVLAYDVSEDLNRGRLEVGGGRDVALRLAQYRRLEDLPWRLGIGRAWVGAKIENTRALLQRARRSHGYPELVEAIKKLDHLAGELDEVTSLPTLMGKEGAAARCYFAAFPTLVRPRPEGALAFRGRSRRP